MTRYLCCLTFGVVFTVSVMPLAAMLLIQFADIDCMDLRD